MDKLKLRNVSEKKSQTLKAKINTLTTDKTKGDFMTSRKITGVPKILLFDIETAPNLGYVWGKWEQDVIENTRDWYMMTFAYKWLGEKTTHAYSLPDFPLYKRNPEDDTALVKKLHELFCEADIVVAHNGNEFDVKKANARFLAAGLNPPTPYKTIDTKLVAKRYFRFDSNALEALGQYLKLGKKRPTGGFSLWRDCMHGIRSAWLKMVHYNKGDVDLLEKVYLRLRPWIATFPITRPDNGTCLTCGGKHLQARGSRFTKKLRIQRLQCTGCGAWSSGKSGKITGRA